MKQKTVRNKFEEAVAATVPAGFAYEQIKLQYIKTHSYTPDWVDVQNKQIIEAKGYWRPEDRAKMRLIAQQHPDWKIKMIFQNHKRTISKTSKTTYSEYCEKHGWEWEQGPVPAKVKK